MNAKNVSLFCVAQSGMVMARSATFVAQSGSKILTHWKQRKIKSPQSGTAKRATIAIKIRALARFQHLLRRVCTFILAGKPTTRLSGDFYNRWSFPAIGICSFGAVAIALFLTVSPSPIVAQQWNSVSSSTEWRSRSAFVENMSAPVTSKAVVLSGSRQLDQLLSIIALAEADKGYDSLQHGARIKTPAPPSQMTVAQIYRWIDATPGQPHAIGR